MSIWYALLADLASVVVLGYLLYFRRHGRRDLLLAYAALNVGVFAVTAVMLVASIELAVGFGLFGVLSIIRLRSDQITQGEIGYYFVAIALGLINAVAASTPVVLAALNVVLLGVLFAADHPRVLPRTSRRVVTLDVVHRNPDTLRADLEARLGGTVHHALVTDVDYVRDLMVVDVRFREGAARRTPVRAGER
ncbi:DUF4956 domain-containing protein [Actinorugispora endophytica]|uniref:Uncharacterized protein DUF4956 n=1 Tax=Actinorugispora endophytica TaxID=1605990 RepID=A0A4R6V3L1_9ACTN|nr:DUF4956 domain-containing protein [Actinorugispora endophytica]TDQ53298.1 uncharacterized protein DUF4956 [Actinorugispora endophytica]